MSHHLSSLFQYKRWANAELLAAGADNAHALPPDDLNAFVRLIQHTHVVDRIFAGHLTGRPHGYTSTNNEDTPSIDALKNAVAQVDDWYLAYVDTLDDAQLAEPLSFTFTDGEAGRMTRVEMLHHVLFHGTYHRGAAGRILFVNGIQPPRDSITVRLHRLEPDRRIP